MHRSEEDLPHDRHWKRAKPLESMDREEPVKKAATSDKSSKKKDKKHKKDRSGSEGSGSAELSKEQKKFLK